MSVSSDATITGFPSTGVMNYQGRSSAEILAHLHGMRPPPGLGFIPPPPPGLGSQRPFQAAAGAASTGQTRSAGIGRGQRLESLATSMAASRKAQPTATAGTIPKRGLSYHGLPPSSIRPRQLPAPGQLQTPGSTPVPQATPTSTSAPRATPRMLTISLPSSSALFTTRQVVTMRNRYLEAYQAHQNGERVLTAAFPLWNLQRWVMNRTITNIIVDPEPSMQWTFREPPPEVEPPADQR